MARELFDWPRLNSGLAEHRLTPPRLRLERAGGGASDGVFKERRTRRGRVMHDLDMAALNAGLRRGATLILDAANELSPPLQALCAGLSAEFLASVQANLYACWGTTQGFDIHWDDHDVFVVQVEGRKRWALYGFTREAPTYRDLHGRPEKPTTPIEELVLEPGDLLYLPRGYWHAAVGQGEPTLHLTIGLTRKIGADFLHWLAGEAMADALARSDLPLEQDDAALGARVAALLASAAATPPDELGRRYRRHVASTLAQRPRPSFPFIGLQADYPPGALLTLADGSAELKPADRPFAFVLSHRGVEYTLAEPLRRAFSELVERRPVVFADLEQATASAPREAAALVSELVGRGVLVVAA